MYLQCFSDLVTDSHRRIHRRHRVLEDHSHFHTAKLISLCGRQVQYVSTIKGCSTIRDFSWWHRYQSHQRLNGDRLPAPRFSNNRKRFAASDIEANASYCFDYSSIGLELDL